ncbi:hypothetical protein [Alicyclobacillus mali (ex Roth et al. 2021)]|uniref:hypothetical protein n=1 Tax=Alicyclobacillus mali (ex Roth et al. 2021) TaxID=1123961 RepID=UPI001A8D9DF2|nr:hypothetical protein [Alicyclobacillus mali (ex Roth et al. 2021)]
MAKEMHPITKLNLEMLKNSNEPLDVLRQWGILMSSVYDTLTELTMEEEDELVTEYLSRIEELDDKIQEFLYEEAAAKIAHFDEATNRVVFDQLPQNLRLVPMEGGFAIRHIPLWMLGHGAKKKFRPAYHRNRPYVRKRQLWFWLIHKLKWDYLRSVVYWENSLIPKEPPQYARMLVQFEAHEHWVVRDLDKYIPMFQVVVNSLRDNSLVQSDRPRYFSYAVEWKDPEVDAIDQEPTCSMYIWTSHQPFTSWATTPVLIEQTNFAIPIHSPNMNQEGSHPKY